MRKRVENNDATQEVSSSQLVADQKLQYPVVNKNDASMWMSQPVSADDFMQPPAKKPVAPKSNNWIVGASAAVVVAAVGVGIWYGVLRDKPKQNAPAAVSGSAAPGSAAAPAPDKPAVAAATSDAGAVAATPDAAVAVAETPGVMNVDAISAADPATKKATTKKRPATKKKATPKKKKTATAPKKK